MVFMNSLAPTRTERHITGLPQILPRDNNADCGMKERMSACVWEGAHKRIDKRVNEQLGTLQVLGQAKQCIPLHHFVLLHPHHTGLSPYTNLSPSLPHILQMCFFI